MPQIEMCRNNECKLKETCYRYQAVPCMDQAYGSFEPKKSGKKIDCKHQIKIDRLPYMVKGRPEKAAQDIFREQSYAMNEERKSRKHDKIIRSDWHDVKTRGY